MMRLLLVVVFESFVKNLLEFSRAGIKFLLQGYVKKLFLGRPVEMSRKAVCFRRCGTCFTTFNTV